jgi:hypothetical protein
VQTSRIATQPPSEYLSDWPSLVGLQLLAEFDEFCQQHGLLLSVSPIINANEYAPELYHGYFGADLTDRPG